MGKCQSGVNWQTGTYGTLLNNNICVMLTWHVCPGSRISACEIDTERERERERVSEWRETGRGFVVIVIRNHVAWTKLAPSCVVMVMDTPYLRVDSFKRRIWIILRTLAGKCLSSPDNEFLACCPIYELPLLDVAPVMIMLRQNEQILRPEVINILFISSKQGVRRFWLDWNWGKCKKVNDGNCFEFFLLYLNNISLFVLFMIFFLTGMVSLGNCHCYLDELKNIKY